MPSIVELAVVVVVVGVAFTMIVLVAGADLFLRIDKVRSICFKNPALPLRSNRNPISVNLSVKHSRILVDVLKGFAQSSAKLM